MRAVKSIEAGPLQIYVMGQVPERGRRQRRRKQQMSGAYQFFRNQKLSWQRLKLVLAANFVAGDWVCTLTFDREPENREAAVTEFKRFIRRLRSARRRRGEDTRYVYCVEGYHGRRDGLFGADGSLEDRRIHIHLVINGRGSSSLEEIRSLWKAGDNIRVEPMELLLVQDLAKYLTKEAREEGKPVKGEWSWRGSLNLRRPKVTYLDIPMDSLTLAPPEGAINFHSWHEKNPYGYSDCIGMEYFLFPKEEKPLYDYARGRRGEQAESWKN